LDISPIDDFEKFLNKEIKPAAKDIGEIDDKTRKHIQKLVYTNLVDRFDTMIDTCVLQNCREEIFAKKALEKASNPVTEADLYGLLIQGEGLQDILTERLKDGLRNSTLRNRHSGKLRVLFEAMAPNSNASSNSPRVNISTGAIVEKCKPANKNVPHSIVGYSDWLYSRRNSIVHGAGTTKFLENDRKQIKNIWKIEVTKTFKISVGSITTAIKFYSGVAEILKKGH
jgi:hypothetical protein